MNYPRDWSAIIAISPNLNMPFSYSYTDSRQHSGEIPESPVSKLLYVNSQGMVFESVKAFESGSRLAIGLHLRKIRGDLGLLDTKDDSNGDRFLKLEGLVVDCKIMAASPARHSYQVTLIFEKLPKEDRLMLESVEDQHSEKPNRAADAKQIGLSGNRYQIPKPGGLN
ncbi:MAG: hypothetical protein GY899_14760 [Verrucomicrobiaceae bacterium]|nr:hypothetical protein [Verrucomicrobiaceae bacterium]